MNAWISFLKKHGGKGYSQAQLRKMYHQKTRKATMNEGTLEDMRFSDLPALVQENIFVKMEPRDILNFCATSKANKAWCDDKVFWQRLLREHFNITDKVDNPFNMYKKVYEIVNLPARNDTEKPISLTKIVILATTVGITDLSKLTADNIYDRLLKHLPKNPDEIWVFRIRSTGTKEAYKLYKNKFKPIVRDAAGFLAAGGIEERKDRITSYDRNDNIKDIWIYGPPAKSSSRSNSPNS